MNDAKKSVEPWQLIMILLLVIAFFGGLYVVSQTITSRLEAVEASVDGKTDMLKNSIDALNSKLDRMRAMHQAKLAAPPAPAAAPAAPAEGEEAEEKPAEEKPAEEKPAE